LTNQDLADLVDFIFADSRTIRLVGGTATIARDTRDPPRQLHVYG
jgi:hypothetical protein